MDYKIGKRVFNDWQIVREIGSGASGKVWEIVKVDHDISTLSALKIIQVPQNPLLKKSLYNDGMNDISVTRFFQEVVEELTDELKIMIDMKGFPYIVNCEDYNVIEYPDEIKWDILIRMELLTPIQTYIRKNILTEIDILKMSKELLQALSLFENRGIIHRDIKPDNIFVDKYGNFKIGDFGIARICDKASTDLSKKGTENYMAPEVFHGKDYDHTVDIYSLGLVLYKFLNNNRLPFYPESGEYSDWDMQQALIDRLSGKKELLLPCSASPEFGKIIIRMCAHNPKERYQRAEEILADLGHITGSVKGIVGSYSEATNLSSVMSKNFDETRAIFESGMIIHDGDVAKKIGKTGITGNGFTKTSTTLSKDERTKTEKKNIRPEKKQEKIEEHNNSEGITSVKNHESAKKNTLKKKTIIQCLSIAAIITTVLLYFLMNKNYSLFVTEGSGAGTYRGGEKVIVTAKDVSGSTFVKWDVTGRLALTDEELTSKTISFKMPRHEISLKAIYDVNKHKVVINNGSGSGTYNAGEEITIVANAPEQGMEFSGWEVEDGSVYLEHANKQKTSFVVPDDEVEISAIYKSLRYSLQVENGRGSGDYEYNKVVRINAEEKSKQRFREWVVLEGDLVLTEDERGMSELSINMPLCNVVIRAEYETNQHEVVINGGSGSGSYEVGEKVTIIANSADIGKEFSGWELEEGVVPLQNFQKEKISFDMPDETLIINAIFKDIDYKLSVNDGNGSGTYHYGDQVQVSAKDSDNNMRFSHWTIDKGTVTISDLMAKNLTFEMPAEDLVVTAHYNTAMYGLEDSGQSVNEKTDLLLYLHGSYQDLSKCVGDLEVTKNTDSEVKWGNDSLSITGTSYDNIVRIHIYGSSEYSANGIYIGMKEDSLSQQLAHCTLLGTNSDNWTIYSSSGILEGNEVQIAFKLTKGTVSDIYVALSEYMPLKVG